MPTQLPLDLGHRPALAREDFLVAPPNAAAVAWIDRWPDWPRRALVLYGPPGSGKSHLVSVWRARSDARLVTGSELAARGPDALAAGAAAVVVEDADRIADPVPLLHLYNILAAAGVHVLVTTREPPARWPGALPDLVSRLAAADTVALGLPDDALIAAVLAKLFADRQLAVEPEVLSYLVARIERSFEAARTAVARLDAAALAARRGITIALVREVLPSL
ncbi:MAG: DnaA/Hda family protein [Rhodospirillales bacterium]